MKTRVLIFTFAGLCAAYAAVCLLSVPSPVRVTFKALPIVLLFFNTLYETFRFGDRSRLLMAAALLLSAFGDISGGFLKMGIFFALAHCFYIVAYCRHFCLKEAKQWVCLAILLLMATGMMSVVFPAFVRSSPGGVMLAVGIVYALLLIAMPFAAISQSRPHWILFAAGSLLFFVSDNTIFINAYLVEVPARHLIVMSTYYSAQLLMNLKA